MMILVSEDVNWAAWKIVRGYFASSLAIEYRKTLRDWVREFKRYNPYSSVEDARTRCLAKHFAYSRNYEYFLQLYKNNLLAIAASQGIGQMEMYHLYIASLLDYVIAEEYPESRSFYDAKYSDEQLLNFAYRFIIGLSLVEATFTILQISQFRSFIVKSRESKLADEEILKTVIERTRDMIKFHPFKRDRGYLLAAGVLGGFTEEEAFEYYQILFAHLVYKVAIGRPVDLKR